jgi:multidrug efflux pump
MMSAKMLRSAEREERGFTGWVNHHFDRLRQSYGRVLDRTLHARPAVYAVWAMLSLMAVPMYMFSPKELAPVEDQGFMFGIINNAANASADQKSHFGRAAEQVFFPRPRENLPSNSSCLPRTHSPPRSV